MREHPTEHIPDERITLHPVQMDQLGAAQRYQSVILAAPQPRRDMPASHPVVARPAGNGFRSECSPSAKYYLGEAAGLPTEISPKLRQQLGRPS